jgi:hypothetical protein
MHRNHQSVPAPQGAYQQAQNTIAPARDRGQLDAASDGIAQELGILGDMLGNLELRLAAVLQPEAPQPPSGISGSAGCAIPVSPAVDYLVVQRQRIESLQHRVTSLLARLDT